ncbi:unnamed protein product [Linum tenue]|uniref:Uncharacterized protein n=1 Tax=Linum tenue TaxID=586396 RepID=A0AAV0KPX1_9ROSI|nr:unnamed protein product [Linum tenue]CAI0424347.1 unnamed protein product [Linum tenue]CAI0448651.1 unnamed protein product [Linum tenue]
MGSRTRSWVRKLRNPWWRQSLFTTENLPQGLHKAHLYKLRNVCT